jgi:hypothetical protein
VVGVDLTLGRQAHPRRLVPSSLERIAAVDTELAPAVGGAELALGRSGWC